MVYRLPELRATSTEVHHTRARTLSLYMGEMELQKYAESGVWLNMLTAAILRDLATVPA